MLVDRSTRDVIAAFASSAPTPGGGSASALASAVGAALLEMVAALPKTKTGADGERAALAAAASTLAELRRKLTEAIEADTAAYDQVVAAYKQPKATPDEQQARTAAAQRALRTATDVPLGVMRLSAQSLALADIVTANGYGAAASDVGVAVALLRAGLHGARLNVEINLGSLTDTAYVAATRTECASLGGA